MPVQIYNEWEIDAALDRTLRKLLQTCFPSDAAVFQKTRAWNGCAPAFTILLRDDNGDIAGHVGVHDRTIRINDRPVHVAGLQNVCVVASQRGKKLIDVLLQQFAEESKRRGFDGGMLFCRPPLIPMYARSGWIYDPTRDVALLTLSVEQKPPAPENQMMWLPLNLQELPGGLVDLRGYDW